MMSEEKMTPAEAGAKDLHMEHRTESDTANLAVSRSEVKAFLSAFGRSKPTLAFKGDRGLMTRVYPSVAAAAGAARWFNQHGCEVYFVANSHRMVRDEKRRITKPKKTDIELCVGVGIDIDGVREDPDVVDALIHHLDWPPTYIAATGGGQQAFWRFDECLSDRDHAEEINYWLVREFGSLLGWDRKDGKGGVDKVAWNCDRIWRLPGTVNIKRGRRSRLLHSDWSARMVVADAPREQRALSEGGEFVAADTAWVTDKVVREVFPHHLWKYLWSSGDERSEHIFRFLQKLFQALGIDRLAQEIAVAILTTDKGDPRFVSHVVFYERKSDNSFVPRPDPEGEAKRQVRKFIEKFGGRYA